MPWYDNAQRDSWETSYFTAKQKQDGCQETMHSYHETAETQMGQANF